MHLCVQVRHRQFLNSGIWRRLISKSAVSRVEQAHGGADSPQSDRPPDGEQSPAFVTSPDGLRTLRARSAGQRPLPVSPILDPLLFAARRRHKQPKAEPEELTPFQKELSLNPFARAITTPIRRCTFTDAVLPSHFLSSFSTVFHETTILPQAPARPRLPHEEYERLKELGQLPDRPSPDLSQAKQKLLAHLLPTNPSDPNPRGHKHHVLLSSQLLHRLTRNQAAWHKLVHQADVVKYGLKDRRDWVWRKDMHDVVLAQMRRQVMAGLRWGFKHQNAGLVVDGDGDGAANCKDSDVGAWLILKGGDEAREEVNGVPEQDTRDQPLTVLPPTYHLPTLLGPKMLTDLVIETVFEPTGVVALMKDWRTTAIQLDLLKLAAFLRPADVVV